MKRAGLFAVVGVVATVPTSVPIASPAAHGTDSCREPAHSTRATRYGEAPWTTRAAPRPRPGVPGARDRSELTPAQVIQVEQQFSRLLAQKRTTASAREASTDVPVYVHVLHSGATGRLPDTTINAQIAVLNRAYGGETGDGVDTGFSFTLRGITRTDNATWYTRPEENETAIKTRLHVGGKGTLNLYTAGLGDQVLGWSTFPWEYAAHPVMDGVVVHADSVPGGSITGFDEGHTAAHEIGHWLGLYHTFQNGCTLPGDAVDDTPYERDPADGCPVDRDTCPAAGTDPVHNFMDYAQDACMNQFSAGQSERMRRIWTAYRS